MTVRIISTTLLLIGIAIMVFVATAWALGAYVAGELDWIFGWWSSVLMFVAGALCWVAAFVVRRWPKPKPEIADWTTCPMCGEPVDSNASICPNCCEPRIPFTRL